MYYILLTLLSCRSHVEDLLYVTTPYEYGGHSSSKAKFSISFAMFLLLHY
jgi:hypothetical protein